ncbi:MAG: hypothetical protein NXI00_11545 [Cytophagales bacterium]|nr:hypothetical protein [Cytophagales bacterium]
MRVPFLAFLFFLMYVLPSQAQISLDLRDKSYNIVAEEYYIDQVLDLRESQYFIGKVYLRNRSKVDMNLSGGTESAFLKHASKGVKQSRNGVPLIIKINALSFTENEGRNGLIEGRARLELSVFALFDGKEVEVCRARSGSSYNRSLGTAHEEAYEPLLVQMWISCMEYTDSYINKNKEKLEVFNHGSQVIIKPFQTRNSRDTVHYYSRKVTWADFKASPPYSSKFAAAIFPSIGIGTSLSIKNGKLTAVIQPHVFMIPSQSWAKKSSQDDASLDHEQLHFDIAMVAMQRLIKKLEKLEAKTMDDLSSMIQYEYLQAYTEMNRLQEQYDAESQHNLNDYGQAKWKKQVRGWLE